jgi:multiple sugar transport system substrate-binding protein
MDKKYYYIIGGVVVLLLILAGVFLFASPSGPKTNPNGKIELVWWKTFEDPANMQDLINDYQTAHKNVTITYVKKDVATYENELVNALAGGQGPDIFSIHNDWLPKHMDKLSPMPDAAMSARTYQDTFLDVAGGDFIKDNKIYAIPLSVDVLGLYYNKDILNSASIAQPPATWPDLVTDAVKITKVSKPGNFITSGVSLGTSSNVNRAVDILNLMMLQNGTKFYSDDLNSASFDGSQTDPATSQSFNPGITALNFYTQFADPSKVSYTWNTKSDLNVDAFTQGKLGMMINYSYMEPTIRARGPNLNWAVAAIPQTDLSASKVNFANYWAESVSKSSKNSAVAWDFLKFISSKVELEKYYIKHKQVSSRKDILPSQYEDNDIGYFAQNALVAKSVYKQDANDFEGIFSKMIDDVILRGFSSADAIKNAAAQINLNLQKK